VAEPPPLWEEGEIPTLEPRGESLAPSSAVAGLAPRQLVYQRLEELEHASVPELARSLELSNSTVLRALRALMEERRVESHGFARATRYRLRAPTE
jgi:predicted transcriptional regulator